MKESFWVQQHPRKKKLKRAGGEIGRHACLRSKCRKAWRFKSSPAHQIESAKFCAREASKLLCLPEDLKGGGMFRHQSEQPSRGRDFCEATAEQKVVTKSSPAPQTLLFPLARAVLVTIKKRACN